MERGMPMFALTKQIKDTVKQLSEVSDDDDCLAIADTLGKVTRMLEDCTKWMLVAFGGGNMHLASASSVAYLHLTGVVVGGWLMGRAALVSREKLRKGEGNLSFYKAKITTARFYNDYILSQGFGYAHAISKGGYSVLELTDDQF
ncbi:MAG: hypothetical protein BWK79_14195 [Beggiatoa sp. IS2]|nr:MAG: hypothetical protein BWK79_14195 [Beggiatoa sp. IS2]